ncbi:MAG TPA: hypothetical protein VGF67_01560 [Ktedonobacteraceae bacterium]|jgi:hypothetical protein
MSKLGKFIVALALGLMMSLALLTTSFAQSAHPQAAHIPAHTATAAAATWGGCGGWGWGGCGGWGWGGCGGWGWGGCGGCW